MWDELFTLVILEGGMIILLIVSMLSMLLAG